MYVGVFEGFISRDTIKHHSNTGTNDLAVLQYTLKLMKESQKRKKRRTLIVSSLRSPPKDKSLSDMMQCLGSAIPMNSVLVVVSRKIDPSPVRQEGQKRWKGRREKSWTSDQEREYRKMIRKTQDCDVYITFNNKTDKDVDDGSSAT